MDAARWVVMVAIVIMMVLTVLDVILRSFFKSPILGVMEYSQMIMVVILLAAASTAMVDKHIKIDILVSRFKPRAKAVCDLVTLAAAFVIAFLIGTRTVSSGIIAIQDELTFLTLGYSKAPFIFLYAAGMFALCLAIVCLFANAVKRLVGNAK